MYVIKKQSDFSDTFEIQSENEIEQISYTLKITPNTVTKFRQLQLRMIDLQKQAKDNPKPELAEQIGKCIIDLFILLFGQENAEKIVALYADNYTNMLIDITPYIYDVIVPRLNQCVKDARKKIAHRFRT